MRGGERVPVVPSQALARLEEREDRHGLAVLWMAAGQWDAAEALLQRMPPSPELDQERAVLDLHRGRLALAERRLLAVLRARPQLAAARWNLGLLYQRQGQRQLARQAFIRVAALSEPGWAVEAQRRARELEQPSANPVQVPAR
jgi:predicted Zn-dependent protease